MVECAAPRQPPNSPNAKKLTRISVSGNRFVDPQGKPLLLKGLSISDPDKIEYQGHWGKAHFEKVKATGAQVVRIPYPIAWREIIRRLSRAARPGGGMVHGA